MLNFDNRGGGKVYHQEPSGSVKVYVNCSERMSPRQLWPQTGRGIRKVSGATYAPSGEWEAAFSLLPLRR